MKAADAPFEIAVTALAELTASMEVRSAFDRLIVPNAHAFLSNENIGGEQKKAFGELLKLRTYDPSPNYRGLLILICTTFEYFCKQTIRNLIDEISSKSQSYSEISSSLLAANFAYTGMFFHKGRDGYLAGKLRNEFDQFASGLLTCSQSSTAVALNSAVFVEFLGNCTPTQLEKRFRELGLADPFGDDIGTFTELKSHFGGGGARTVAKSSRTALEELIDRRNTLVHSMTVSETVTSDEVADSIRFVRALIGALKDLVGKA